VRPRRIRPRLRYPSLDQKKHVNHETLAAAVSVYILFGIALSRIYWLLQIFDPDSFHLLNIHPSAADQHDFLYYSFVVMTTVGFGDIVPITKLARSITNFQSIISVFCLAIMISRLVSLYRTDELRLDSPE
jgi:voltage-gated potassium channel